MVLTLSSDSVVRSLLNIQVAQIKFVIHPVGATTIHSGGNHVVCEGMQEGRLVRSHRKLKC